MSHVKDGEVRSLQGPGSELVKYRKCLCSPCNNDRSQPFDRAYDKFFQYVIRREAEIVERRVIDFADVYDASPFPEEQTSLYKYFVKLFGCDLSSHGLPVPKDLKELLDMQHFRTKLRVTFAVNEDKLVFGGAQHCPVGIGKINFWPSDARVSDERSYAWSTYFSFLHICFWYAMSPTGPFGSVWMADSQWVYLGWFTPLSPEERREFEKKARAAPWRGQRPPGLLSPVASSVRFWPPV